MIYCIPGTVVGIGNKTEQASNSSSSNFQQDLKNLPRNNLAITIVHVQQQERTGCDGTTQEENLT